MPLYPLLISLLSKVLFFLPMQWIGFILSFLCFLGSLIYINKLIILDYSKKQAQKVLLFLIILPTSFFFICVYSESLFLFLTVASFYYARKKMWIYAALCGFFASLTRIVGFVIIIPLVIEYFSQHKTKKLSHIFALCCIPIGTIVYAVYNYFMRGNPLYFLQAHSQLSNGRSSTFIILFPQTLYRYSKILTTVSVSFWEWKIAALELLCFLLATGGIYLLWKNKVRLSYIVYTAISLLIPASSGTFTGLPRYILVLFPLFFLIVYVRNRIILTILYLSLFFLQILLFIYFCRGYFVA